MGIGSGRWALGWMGLALYGSAFGAPAPQGMPIACGDRVTGTLAVGEFHDYAFSVPTPGAIAPTIVDLAELDAGFEACIDLYAPGGALIGSGCYGIDDGTLAVTGTYTLRVYDDGSDQNGSYALDLEAVSESLTCGDSITCGERVTGTLAAGEVHAYTFAAPMAGAIAPTIVDLTDIDAGFDACLELYSPSGAFLGSGCYGIDNGALSTPGVYTLLVFDDGADQSGSYALDLEAVSESLTCGQSVGCGTNRVEVLIEFGQVDGYTLELSAPTPLRLGIDQVIALDPGFFAYGELYGPSGAFLGPFIDWVGVLSPGHYTILVFDDESDQRGSYRLRIHCRTRPRRL